jgi:hypothetical protein
VRTYTIPYLYKDGPNWSAVDIHNDNNAEHTVIVEFFSHPDHVLRKTVSITLPVHSSHIVEPAAFPFTNNSRHIMRITGPDNLLVTHVYVGPWQMQTIGADL